MLEIVENEHLDRGYHGTARTVERMHDLVTLGKLDSTIRKIAVWIRMSVSEDQRGSSRKVTDEIYRWVKAHGEFTRDPFQIERIEHPIALMLPVFQARRAGAYKGGKFFAGDCDGYAIMFNSLAGALGFQTGFETIKADAQRPDEFSHIYSVVLVGSDWVPYDPSTPSSKPAWRPPVPEKYRKIWPEKPLEGVPTMNYWDDDDPGLIPADYVGSGGVRYGNGKINQLCEPACPEDPGDLDVQIPHQPARTREDTRCSPPQTVDPSTRAPIEPSEFFGRPHYEGKKPRIHERLHPVPPNLPQVYAIDTARYEGQKPYIHERQPVGMNYDRQLHVGPGVFVSRKQEGEQGMGAVRTIPWPGVYELPPAGVAAEAQALPVASVQKAGTTVGSVISDIINVATKTVVPGLTQAYVDKVQAKYATKVAEAEERVLAAKAGQQVIVGASVPMTVPTEGKSLFSNPLVLVGGLALVGGVIYFATR